MYLNANTSKNMLRFDLESIKQLWKCHAAEHYCDIVNVKGKYKNVHRNKKL